jgi:hypothetical protein
MSKSFYISPKGNDGNLGTSTQPFLTLEAAQRAARAVIASGIPSGGIVIYLRSGVYLRSASFAMSEADSGRAGRYVAYKAYGTEKVRIIGGVRLNGACFVPRSGVPSGILVGELVYDLAGHGIEDYGQLCPRGGFGPDANAPMELFINGVPMALAGTDTLRIGPDGKILYFGSASADNLIAHGWVHGNLGAFWYNELIRVASYNAATHEIGLAMVPKYGVKLDRFYRVVNLLEELTEPGEYFIDRFTGQLFLIPPEGVDLANADIVVSMMEQPLLTLTGANYVRFEKLTLEAVRGDLVRIEGGSNCCLSKCTLRNFGRGGAVVSGSRNGLEDCIIAHAGERGVHLTGGDRAALKPAENFVRHCNVHDWGRWVRTSKVAVHIEGVGQIVARNTMHDAPHQAIWFYGNNHIIEFNDIHHVCQETADAGAIYAGRSWDYRGNVIRYNFIHDLASPYTPWEIFGVYLDDAQSGTEVYGNVFARLGGIAMFNGGGRDNHFANNVIIGCYTAHRADRRGVAIITNAAGHDCNFLQKLRIACRTEGNDFHGNAAWMKAYPELQPVPSDFAALGDLKNPGGSTFARNAGSGNTKWITEGSLGGPGAFGWYASVKDNQPNATILLDEVARTLQVVGVTGWQEIPFGEIG